MKFFRRKPKPRPNPVEQLVAPATKKVYFFVRSERELPLGHRIVEFAADSVLDWVQRYWIVPAIIELETKKDASFDFEDLDDWSKEDLSSSDEVEAYTERLVGEVYGFTAIWDAMIGWGVEPPKDEDELREWAESILTEGEIVIEDGYFLNFTNDDEIQIEMGFISQDFVVKHPERVKYLFHDDWAFPLAFSDEGKKLELETLIDLSGGERQGAGCIYCVLLTSRDGETIGEIGYDGGVTGSFKFEGMRLPELGSYLKSSQPPSKQAWDGEFRPFWEEELLLLRAHLIINGKENLSELLETMGDDVNRLCVSSSLSDILYKKPQFISGGEVDIEADLQELRSLEADYGSGSVWSYSMGAPNVQATPHFCQMRFQQISTAPEHNMHSEYLNTVFYFDDLWVAANPELAESLVRYSTGFNFLKGRDEKIQRSIDRPYVEPTEEEKLQAKQDESDQNHLGEGERQGQGMSVEDALKDLFGINDDS